MENLPDEYVDIILKYADEVDGKKATNRKYSNFFVLSMICEMLEHVTKWRSLGRGLKRKRNFYSAILKRFIKWSHAKVFEKAYYELLKEHISNEIEEDTITPPPFGGSCEHDARCARLGVFKIYCT